jgi:hypothetical protein
MHHDQEKPMIKLRQAVVAVPDVDAAGAEARKELGLAPGFPDPLLHDVGMADESIILGDGASFLEFVGPLRPDTGIQRWLDKAGPGGYCLSIQVGDIAPYLERAEAAGVTIAADLEVYGYRIAQLHPKRLGLLIELDEIPDPAVWFWDDVEKEIPTDPQVDSFVSIELESADPAAQSALWAEVFGVEVTDVDGTPQIRIGELVARFVAGRRRAMTGIELKASAGATVAAGTLELSGVRFTIS